MARPPRKALRIGIIQRGRIVEERLVRERGPVTIGASPRNTFTVPQSDLAPTFTLFRVERGERVLAFDDRMDGRIQGPSGAADFGLLVSQGAARREGDVHLLPVREDQWGKVLVGEVTVLFQFVTPPPEPPRPTLPPAARGNRFRSMDALFVLVLAASLAAHVAAYAGLSKVEVREEVTLDEIPDRFAKLLIPERRPQAPAPREEKPVEVVEQKAEEKPAEKKADERREGPAEDPGKAADRKAARAAAVARAVQSKGILRVLGSLGPGAARGGAVADVFGHGGGLGDVAAALAGAGGVAVATDPGAPAGRRGGGTGAPAHIGDLATSGGGGGKVALGAKSEVQVTSSVAAEDADIDSPDVDGAKLGAFVRARMGAIKACYESQLKRNPGLRGKIRIRFTILETGALADVVAADNGVGSSEVAACIIATMSAWRTPFRPGAPVTVEYPFVFSAS
ncbi:MAG TPA: AgmX/PglI C-terminal domain-containing protein [Anaeromyxobacteraceae bacterium]|nr:AgmX/PglI C-terminal domain-containing protein [Anaeromyxobacteraceae bacterium]